MKNAGKIETIPKNMENIPELNQAFNIASRGNLTRKELEDLHKRELFIQDQQAIIIKSKKENSMEIARKLLGVLDEETISKTTDLSIKEIRTL